MDDRAELLEQITAARADFTALFEDWPAAAFEKPLLNNGWTAKDLLGHIAAWERWLIEWLNGRESDIQSWDDIHRRNEITYRTRKDWLPAQVQADFAATFAELAAQVQALSPAQLADEKIRENIADSTFKHYAGHKADCEAALSAAGSAPMEG